MVEIIRGALGTKEGGSLPQGLWQTEQIRALERNWAAREGQPLYALMERAGAALRTYATLHWPDSHCWWIFVGPGNNGGGGYVWGPPSPPNGDEGGGVVARAPPHPKGGGRRG
ncbi:NAD(P)H-hydrate epimerase, partial [Aeromonas veronii]|uniref:NAD(P)H-hydrate epimerase n=1 Tax=Aeromonas veronii TaxID=654 RepID=UPI003D000ED7